MGNFDEEGAKDQQYYFSGNAYTEEQLKDLLLEAGFNLVSLKSVKPWIWATVQRKAKPTTLPQVSAIISTYNSEKFLRGCLEDLVNQTLYKKGKLEIIIIDSASEEKEGAIAQEWQTKYPQIIYQRTPERETIYAAWNRGIKIAKGNYITNANTDDRHRPDALEFMANYLDNNPQTSLVYGDQLVTTVPNDSWVTTQADKCWNWPEFDYQELERRCIIGPQPMWRKSLHERYGYFRSEFRVAGDYEFWLRIGKNEKFVRLPEILGLYFENEQGLEKSSSIAHIETQEIWKTYGIIARKVKPKISIPVPINTLEINNSPSIKTILSTEKKFHILLYTDEPGIYGVGQCNHSILCELIKSGYIVSCVQSRASNYLTEQQKKLGIQHFWLEYDTVKNFSQTLTNLAEAKQLLSTIQPDTIIFSDCCPFSNLAAKQVAIQLEIPFVVLVNFAAPYLAERFHSYLGKLSEIYAYSRQTIAVSQENLHQLWELFQLPKQSGKVIYNGRPSKYFTPINAEVRSRLRQQLGIPENAVVCFTSARLEAIKGYQYQLETIKFLKESNVWSQIYFVWVGSGSLESQLKTEISQLGVTDKVKVLGERDDIPELLDTADIFVFPSQFEGMPLAIIEAMAKGLPVVASAVSGIPEELGETGKLLPDPKIDSQATVKELVETIQEWTLNPNLRHSIAQACQQRAEKMFTEERMLTETLEVIKSTLPKQKPLVSVIIPCYQQAHFLSEAVASVVSQTYNNWEIIIVNDGSPDNTSEVARQIIQLFPHHKISLVEKERGGCASARNVGINHGNGEYILPLDADDKLSSHAISCLMDIAISKSHACVVFGSYEIFGTEERKIITVDEYSVENIKKYNMLVCTSLYAKSIYNLTNGYKEEIKESGYEDWEFWLNCHRHNIPFYGIRETILYYRRHPESRVVKSFSNRNYYWSQVISYYPDLFDAETIKKAGKIFTSNKTPEETGYNLEKIAVDVQEYKQNPQNIITLTNLQTWRKQVANSWLVLATENLETAYGNSIGKAHKILITCGIQNEILTEEEQNFVDEIKTYLIQGLNQPKALQYLLAGMLYGRADRLQLKFEKAPIPKWFANDYLKYMFSAPSLFLEIGEADNYACYMEKWLEYIDNNITNNPGSKLWQEIALLFTQNANFIPIYFASLNLKKVYSLRAKIMEFVLKNQGNQIDYEFPTRSPNRNKIRLGIIKEHFQPQSETYSILPVFEHLNREKFELILYTNNQTNHPLEQYCCSCVDRVVKLENDTQKQVQTIRGDDLDILIVGTNITAITRPITLLMFHRLARIQATLFSSPVTTGIRNIDYYISGKLSETITFANQHYTEKLALLENAGFCFNYYPISSTPAQVYPTRQSWKATDETVIFISGANFYKIIPELAETWAKVLAEIPNSILVLYPFAPSWSSTYPAIAFLNRMHKQLAKYKIERKRLVLIKALPTRTDVKECLKQADIYLDSYPYSGSNSLVDPLEVGIPTVVMDGEFLRQKQGAALLRTMPILDLIANSESEYINLAVKLANNSEFRQQKSQEILEKMQQSPSFLDSLSYSTHIGELFQGLFQEWQNIHAPKTIESTNKNSLTSEFINRLIGCVNLYEIDPTDQSLIEELRQIRKQIADFWLTVAPKELETTYQGKIRQAYQTLLKSGIQNEPQTEDEQKFLKELAETSMGLTNPKAINTLLGAMLYFPPSKMLVRDAKNRLPKWLIDDYQQIFESREVAEKLEKAFKSRTPHLSEYSPVKNAEVKPEKNVALTANQADDLDIPQQKFINQLLGSVNLYYIDPSDESVVQDLRKIRKQMADFWINLEPQKLETFYSGKMGKAYQALLSSGMQNQALTNNEQAFLQQLAVQLAKGIEAPKTINYLLAAMLYCRQGQLQIQDMSKLPHWLLEDYQKFVANS
ncbi:glycosyltransferase [Okeania sp. SIO2B3]|uniref:glycosyltransferase n=1 Tax=Okeania sp. SIO2B3 TaxID=2607784 RepID=UPI0025DB1905|nr:glycosyltransferase [Okeania sp. SIO2B3]